MEKIKKQFGTATIDGQDIKYCEIRMVIGKDEPVNQISLTEQFRLLAESFWIYIKELDDAKRHADLFKRDNNTDFDDSALKKGWF